MSKCGYILLSPINLSLASPLAVSFKKSLLLFDQIYVSDAFGDALYKSFLKNPEIEFLFNENLLIKSETPIESLEDHPSQEVRNIYQIANSKAQSSELQNVIKSLLTGSLDTRGRIELLGLHDLLARMEALHMSTVLKQEVYPLLNTDESFTGGERKHEVVQFVLQQIPEPVDNTPWEHIIEFRQDLEVRNKYLALINWVNKISSSCSTLNEINEEYEYLHSEYMKHFKLHKMKYTYTALEIIVTAGAGILVALQNSQFILPLQQLIKMKLSHVHLLIEEAKLPGREVAYIHKVNQTFTVGKLA